MHLRIQSETRCSNFMADDIHKYVIKTVHNNKNTIYDFLLGISPKKLTQSSSDYKLTYQEEVGKIFLQEFRYDYVNDKVMSTKTIPNMRLHYVDIRYPLEMDTIEIIGGMLNITSIASRDLYLYQSQIKLLDELRQKIIGNLSMVYDVYFKKEKQKGVQHGGKRIFEMDTQEQLDRLMTEIINKIRNSYANNNVKKILVSTFDNIINYYYNNAAKYHDELIKELDHFEKLDMKQKKSLRGLYDFMYQSQDVKQYILNLSDIVDNFCMCVNGFFNSVMNIYFLRRFLDKKYITNSITYTGSFHACTYLHILVKYFDFEITHIVHSDIKDLKKLNAYVKKYTEPIDNKFMFTFLPEQLEQCVDLKDFPPNLT